LGWVWRAAKAADHRLNLNDLDPAGRERAVQTMLEGIDEAYEMGPAVLGF
jgi:hypothetical protein